MIHERRRLIPTMIAVIIGVAFVASTLMLMDSIKASTLRIQAAAVGDATAVVTAKEPSKPMSSMTVGKVAAVPGVTSVEQTRNAFLQRTDNGQASFVNGHLVPAHPHLVKGRAPTKLDQVAVNQSTADNNAGIGSKITVNDPSQNGTKPITLIVVGVLDPDARTTTTPTSPEIYLSAANLGRISGHSGANTVYVNSDRPAPQIAQEVSKVVGTTATVRTADDERAYEANQASQGFAAMTTFMGAFAVIALAVAAIVIVNTFTILVAQRTRTLALAHCIGATRKQVRRSVLGEALIAGLIGSVVGTALGIGVTQLMLMGLKAAGSPIDTSVSVTVTSCIIPILVGVVVTTLAALPPARRATKVAPVVALQPVTETPTRKVGRVRVGFGTLLFLAGTALVIICATSDMETKNAVMCGVAGGFISFAGVLVLAPVLIGSLGRAIGVARLGGIPGELAIENTQRNPRRTATTASALLIGVTLIATVATGAATGRASIGNMMNGHFPVDATVRAQGPLNNATIGDVKRSDGVCQVATVTTVPGTVEAGGKATKVAVQAASPEFPKVVRDESAAKGLDDSHAVGALPGVADGSKITVTVNGKKANLTLVRHGKDNEGLIVTQDILTKLAPHAQPTEIRVRYQDGTDQSKATQALSKSMSTHPGVTVTSSADQKAQMDKIINIMLGMVVGLLVISVIIAIVGVANTLGLSVVERTREIGLLRALGLTRAQVRSMFGKEALMLSGIAAILGIALGIGYGIAGSHALFGSLMTVETSVPWLQLLIVALVAVLTGWLASVIPGRRGATIKPAVALAEE
ncbi:FtsX-like permease family protein [Cutibacterium acnes]|uniref:ABC transporter permease n=1 Tax=Cutibacterium acnes TaxID=1747 RepID=UPI0008A5E466|nr:FtsX-like permease family protein [Cutibacterium acnes]OFK52014.1 ABC transporter permease [Propionibacterium sp. HMSC069G10]MCD1067523.1 FtsX-like permease family protein [Cutibacterium acnes]MCP9405984.1 FtsX-like permease family protein [Cutibacterium acnes]MDF2201329.1 FtsX-like permease family protein [Cutibacterium acnes subsp. defendens]MDF2242642.1 FtsX-like permease family protein [Cutibacterium acnes subsp. defendens]